MLKVRLQASATLDEKGRLALPAQLKRALGDKGLYKMVWLAHGGAIWGYTLDDFEEIEASWAARDPFDPEVMRFSHAVLATAQDVEVDKQGRVNVPPMLRKMAGLERNIVITSLLNRVEIWDAARWDARHEAALGALNASQGATP